jgi:hypothetical protein
VKTKDNIGIIIKGDWKFYLGDQMKEDEMSGTCRRHILTQMWR